MQSTLGLIVPPEIEWDLTTQQSWDYLWNKVLLIENKGRLEKILYQLKGFLAKRLLILTGEILAPLKSLGDLPLISNRGMISPYLLAHLFLSDAL